jgi:nitrogenase molybdenum-iron cofactor biosynthesis protein NifE
MKPDEILALQNEPACAHNRKSKSGCARPQPGATQGGCCFDGARNALVPVTDAAHIVHGPIGCAGSSWDARGSRSSGPVLYRIGMTTDLAELDVILGSGTERLIAGVGHVVERYKPAAVFLYNTCITAMSGDDLAVIARTAAERWSVPVVPVDCGGFYGNKNLGNRIAGDVLLQHVIGTAEPDPLPASAERPGIRTHTVNLIGEWNVGGEFWNVAPLFDELGLRVLCTLSGDARFHDLQAMHRAEANMVVCSKAMLSVARGMQERWGMPFFEGSFYGIADTSQALRDFARVLDDTDLARRTEALIAREEATAEAALADYRRRLAGKRVLIFSGGFKSWSVIAAMQELGLTVVASGTEKSTEEDKARIHALMGPDARTIDDNDQVTLLRLFDEYEADIFAAGDRYIYPALKARVPFLDLDHVRDVGYAGYAGMLQFARQVAVSVESPVWGQVRSRPRWWHDEGRRLASVGA